MTETLDTLSTGGIRILQPRKGYRYSLESLILPFFPHLGKDDAIVELGAGAGVISMILARRCRACRITAVEIQERLHTLLSRNLAQNGLEDQVRPLLADIRRIEEHLDGGAFDLVCCNPPFRKARSGRINPDPEKAMARHEIALSLEDLVRSVDYLLKRRGRFVLIYLPERLTDLILALRRKGLEPRRMQTIHSFPATPAVLLMVEAVKGVRPGMKVEAPFVIYRDQSKGYSAEMEAIYGFRGE